VPDHETTLDSGGPRSLLPGGGRRTRTTSMRATAAARSDDRCIRQRSTVFPLTDTGAGLDERRLRDAFGRFATGVAFVTAEIDGTPLGLIVSSFAAVSIEPPLVSFCPARTSLTWRRMRAAGRFDVHVLGAPHGDFARRAAAPGADRFAEPEVLRDALAVLECELEAELPAGDHAIVIGVVRSLRVAPEGDPLVYYAGGFGVFHPY
jgi:3-hydroxy-9,10-secoandrosta-1,3,5(10)-triene-9,17-dione monooxygenase reductase component